ncbi:hypothetical protein [Sediminimonas qiaohouensis]|uniref:hypothetical protein n=1 Tax=Sediminimonas qiaohouensis TaxID=552061 RepID=UPI000414807E|nr:hypothetical protein [Sediminimonas qiaohouensis]
MSSIGQMAERVLITASVSVVMSSSTDPSFRVYLDALSEALPDSADCDQSLSPVWHAASQLCDTEPGQPRQNALARLTYEVRHYFLRRFGDRYDEFRARVQGA